MSQTHSSSNHLHDIQVRVFLGDAILESSDIFDYDDVSSWRKVLGQANTCFRGVAHGDSHQRQESRRDEESRTHHGFRQPSNSPKLQLRRVESCSCIIPPQAACQKVPVRRDEHQCQLQQVLQDKKSTGNHLSKCYISYFQVACFEMFALS
jgi:hypothetical protein